MSKRLKVPALAVVLSFGFLTLLQAEVAVNVQLGQPPTTSLSGIVVDPDPINGDWASDGEAQPTKFVLNPDGDANGDGPPSAAFAPGTSFPSVVWSSNTPSGFDVVISRFDGSGWSAAMPVSAGSGDELDPKLLIDPSDGSHHVVYWIDDTTPRVMYRWAPADLSAWSEPIQVSHLSDVAVRPSLTLFEGQLQVAYELHGGGMGVAPRQIAVAVWDGQNFNSEIIATTQHAGANWPTVHSTCGKMWVEWIDSDAEVAWTRRLPTASWEPIGTIGFENSMELFQAPGAVRQLALE